MSRLLPPSRLIDAFLTGKERKWAQAQWRTRDIRKANRASLAAEIEDVIAETEQLILDRRAALARTEAELRQIGKHGRI